MPHLEALGKSLHVTTLNEGDPEEYFFFFLNRWLTIYFFTRALNTTHADTITHTHMHAHAHTRSNKGAYALVLLGARYTLENRALLGSW